MSSKSRKHSPKSGQKHRQPGDPAHSDSPQQAAQSEGEHAEPSAEDFLEAEELLKTPKGKSPLLYGFLILLLIFLLIVFVAGDAFYAGQRSQGLGRAVMRWNHPTEGLVEVSARDFRLMAEKLDRASGRGARVDDEQVAQYMVLDALARDAGVRVGNSELAQRLKPFVDQLGSLDAYKAYFRGFPGPGAGFENFEAFVRDQLAIERMSTLLSAFATTVPDLDQVVELWVQQHQLRDFDLTYVDVADFADLALGEQPSDATLQAWLDGLPDFKKREYERRAARGVRLVGARFDGEAASFDALLAAYPEPEETDPTTRAREYYDRSFFTRFRRAQPLPAEGDDATDDPIARIYLPFEEVEEQAVLESAVYGALKRWREELATRLGEGQELDLAAEAERLGLTLEEPEGLVTQPDLNTLGGLGGREIAGPLFGLQEVGQLTPGVSIVPNGLAIGRVLEIRAASMPPAAEIRDSLLEPWSEDRAVELASAAIEALRAEFESIASEGLEEGTEAVEPVVIDRETFVATVESAALPIERLEGFDRAEQLQDPTPVQRFLRAKPAALSLPEGGVSEALEAPERDRIYLVRLDATRDPDVADLTASEFNGLLETYKMFQGQIPPDDPFSLERLRERYGLWLESDTFRGEDDAEPGPTAP